MSEEEKDYKRSMPVDVHYLPSLNTIRTLSYFKSKSLYDQDKNQEYVPTTNGKEIPIAQIAREIQKNRPTVKNQIEIMKKEHVIEFDEKEKAYIIPQMTKNYVLVYQKTLKYCVKQLQDTTAWIYLLLKNQWNLHKMLKEKTPNTERYRFSNRDLMEMLGYSKDNHKMSAQITESLATLKAIGLIDYKIVKKGAAYYKELLVVNDKPVVVNNIIKKDNDDKKLLDDTIDVIPQKTSSKVTDDYRSPTAKKDFRF